MVTQGKAKYTKWYNKMILSERLNTLRSRYSSDTKVKNEPPLDYVLIYKFNSRNWQSNWGMKGVQF